MANVARQNRNEYPEAEEQFNIVASGYAQSIALWEPHQTKTGSKPPHLGNLYQTLLRTIGQGLTGVRSFRNAVYGLQEMEISSDLNRASYRVVGSLME